jgi:hypothetical protein
VVAGVALARSAGTPIETAREFRRVTYLQENRPMSLKTPPPPPGSLDPQAAKRGETLFNGKAACAACHIPPTFTDVLAGGDPTFRTGPERQAEGGSRRIPENTLSALSGCLGLDRPWAFSMRRSRSQARAMVRRRGARNRGATISENVTSAL